jgi:uncharacterized membrane protein SirB2
MNPVIYYILHLIGLFVLAGWTFFAFAGPAPETRKRVMMLTGIASLVVLIGGFGLVAKVYANNFAQGWLIVKIICWLGLSSLAGIAYRRPEARGTLSTLALVFIAVAVYMVYAKPF